jgi:hypothetical protein
MAVAVVGQQTPRIMSMPEGADYSFAEMALEWLDQIVGFELDPWQKLVLREGLAELEPGSWASTEVGLVVPRQNGKGAILEARELVGLFLLKESLLIHSAHQFKTAEEHWLRLCARIEDVPELRSRVAAMPKGAGTQGVTMKSGARLRILARKGGSGRGFSAPFVAFDEAMDLPEATVGDMVPTQSAMPRRQRWFSGSAVDKEVHSEGVVFARVRERGIRGDSRRLAFFEWSLDRQGPDQMTREEMLDDELIAEANPGYGIRLFREAVEDEMETFVFGRSGAVERFNVGDWPRTDGSIERKIDLGAFDALTNTESQLQPPYTLTFDVSPERKLAVALSGRNQFEKMHTEIQEHRQGTQWFVPWLTDMYERCGHDIYTIAADGIGPAGSLRVELDEAGLPVEWITSSQLGEMCGHFVDLVAEGGLQHLGSDELRAAVAGAADRPLNDRWAWKRISSSVDISPLVAATIGVGIAAGVGLGEVAIF